MKHLFCISDEEEMPDNHMSDVDMSENAQHKVIETSLLGMSNQIFCSFLNSTFHSVKQLCFINLAQDEMLNTTGPSTLTEVQVQGN